MFGFDERYAMFDITPVENQFILEYLPDAKGDYVKVYLYGLMRCYHPEDDMSLERMGRELNMTEDDVAAAFRYWERRGLVRRVSDKPPKWQYINIKQKDLSGGEARDPEYEAFSDAVYAAFDKVRRLHGSELSKCFEWREDMNLPTEVTPTRRRLPSAWRKRIYVRWTRRRNSLPGTDKPMKQSGTY